MAVFKLFEISFFRLNMATTIAPLYVNVSVQYICMLNNVPHEIMTDCIIHKIQRNKI